MIDLNSWVQYLSLGVLFFAGYLYYNQTLMIYASHFPQDSRSNVDNPAMYGMEYEDVNLTTSDGFNLHAYFVKSHKNPKNTILFCHANAGNMGHRLPTVQRMIEFGNVFIFSYRGYGKSDGEGTNEAGMKLDVQTALNYLLTENSGNNLFVFGQSIGAAVAIYVTKENPGVFKGLIVENPFLSIKKLIPIVFPIAKYFVFLCTEIWDNENTIQSITENIPFLCLLSEKDELVPPSHQEKLFNLAPMEKKFLVKLSRATHNDASLYQEYWTGFSTFIKGCK
jgi:dienelactone hydrolase